MIKIRKSLYQEIPINQKDIWRFEGNLSMLQFPDNHKITANKKAEGFGATVWFPLLTT